LLLQLTDQLPEIERHSWLLVADGDSFDVAREYTVWRELVHVIGRAKGSGVFFRAAERCFETEGGDIPPL